MADTQARGRACVVVCRPLEPGRSSYDWRRRHAHYWYHLADALRAAIGAERPDRVETALAVAEPGDAERLAELLAGWAAEEAGSDLDRSERLASAWGYAANNRRAIEHYTIDRSARLLGPDGEGRRRRWP